MTRLRALVLLPTRGLAVQVHKIPPYLPHISPIPPHISPISRLYPPYTPPTSPLYLPGRAVQVHKVFAALCRPTPLRVGLAVGQEGRTPTLTLTLTFALPLPLT